MKFIHCADIHLGAKLMSLPAGRIRNRAKSGIIESFNNILNYARANNISIIVMSGDVFDYDLPTKKVKSFFYDVIKRNSDIKFLYLRGNHDINESYTLELPNLITFSNEWKSIKIQDVVFTGIELNSYNRLSLYASLNLNPDDVNVVLLHGDINTKGKDYIDLSKLANKNIDYLALGHIHSFLEKRMNQRGVAIYPGCTAGKAFDECGQKGFVEVEVINHQVTYKFISNQVRQFKEIELDVTNLNGLYDVVSTLYSLIDESDYPNFIRITLTGRVEFDTNDIESDIESTLRNRVFHIEVINKTIRNVKLEEYEKDFSLKGEFVRLVKSKNEFSESYKDELLSLGLDFLNEEDLTK